MTQEKRKILTLCIILRDPHILLGMKKRGFGAGRWNGFGGHVEKDEEIRDAAVREVHEEAGIEVVDMEKHGVIEFSWESRPDVLEVHVFRATDFRGEPAESDEMRPEWFHVHDIPFDDMWSDDRHWLPLLLEGKRFTAEFLFDDSDRVVSHSIRVTDQV